MKQERLRARAHAVAKVVFSVLVTIGVSAAFPAGAQDVQPTMEKLDRPVTINGITCRYLLDGPLPSSSSGGEFSPWRKMHPHTFDGKLESYVGQCKSTVGKLPWLTNEACDSFSQALKAGSCAVVKDVNHIDIDVVRGKRNGHSVAFINERMQLEEPRQAIFVSLPGDIWLGMFAGEPGKSCNNFFALRDVQPPPPEVIRLPPPPIVEVVAPPPKEKKCRFVQRGEEVLPSTLTYVNSVEQCGKTIVPSFVGVVPGGSQSGSVMICE